MDEILTPGNTLDVSSNNCNINNSNNNNASVSAPFRSPPASHLYNNMYPASIHRGVCH
jgi:hypothetical protein